MKMEARCERSAKCTHFHQYSFNLSSPLALESLATIPMILKIFIFTTPQTAIDDGWKTICEAQAVMPTSVKSTIKLPMQCFEAI
jgi:hypothetical protein